MTPESLRALVIEKQRSSCRQEPGAHAIANMLGAFQWWIYEADTPEFQTQVLEVFGYSDIESLRNDATDLIQSLQGELSPEDWNGYFSRRRKL